LIDYVESAFDKQIKQKLIINSTPTPTHLLQNDFNESNHIPEKTCSSKKSDEQENHKSEYVKRLNHYQNFSDSTNKNNKEDDEIEKAKTVKEKIKLFTNKKIIYNSPNENNNTINAKNNNNYYISTNKIKNQNQNRAQVCQQLNNILSEKSQSLKQLNEIKQASESGLMIQNYNPYMVESSIYSKKWLDTSSVLTFEEAQLSQKTFTNSSSLISIVDANLNINNKSKLSHIKATNNNNTTANNNNNNETKRYSSTSSLAVNPWNSATKHVINCNNHNTTYKTVVNNNFSSMGGLSIINEKPVLHKNQKIIQINNSKIQDIEEPKFNNIKEKIAYFSSKSGSDKLNTSASNEKGHNLSINVSIDGLRRTISKSGMDYDPPKSTRKKSNYYFFILI
jgi:hypothetical protein